MCYAHPVEVAKRISKVVAGLEASSCLPKLRDDGSQPKMSQQDAIASPEEGVVSWLVKAQGRRGP